MRRALGQEVAMPQVRREFINFDGGLDTETPPLRLKSGFCYEAQNFEPDINGGYSRIEGYERFDGQPKPSDAIYTTLEVTITGSVIVGDTVVGVTSAATGVVIALGAADAYLVLTKVTGIFNASETLNVSASPEATTTAAPVVGGAPTPILDAQYFNLASDEYRTDIAIVPGSGNILGVWLHGNVVYAFRNNAGATAAVMHKSTSAGWVAVALNNEILFTVGDGDIDEGDTLTQTGTTATILRVVITSGSLATSDAAGKLIIGAVTSGPYASGAATTTGAGTLTLTGAETALTLAAGGRYEFVNANFGGGINTQRMYGCDGVNRAFEFDGTVYVPIDTGMTTDTPEHIHFHKNYLFLSFISSVQHSAIGDPYVWSAIFGAGELAMGDLVSGFMSQPGSELGGSLQITTKNKVSILYGSGTSDWNLVTYTEDLGAFEYTLQKMEKTLFLDDIGVTMMQTAQAFGNFASASISQRIKSFINAQRSLVVGSCLIRDKNQYRIFFSTGYVLIVTISNGKLRGMMPALFNDPATCVSHGEMTDGSQAAFFGSSTGMVYQQEKGTSFDGDAIEAYIFIAFNFPGGQRMRNRFRHASFEVRGFGYTEFSFSYDIDYSTTLISQPGSVTKQVNLAALNWDTFTWDAFIWDGVTLTPEEASLDGTGENISLKLATSGDYFFPIRFSGVTLTYTPRRLMR